MRVGGLGSDGQGWKPGTTTYCCGTLRPVAQTLQSPFVQLSSEDHETIF